MQVTRVNGNTQGVNYGQRRPQAQNRPQQGSNVPMTNLNGTVTMSAAAFSALLAAVNPNAAMAANPAYNNAPTRNMYPTEVVMRPKSPMAQMKAEPKTFVMNSANLNRLHGQSLVASAVCDASFNNNINNIPPSDPRVKKYFDKSPTLRVLRDKFGYEIDKIIPLDDEYVILGATWIDPRGDRVRAPYIYARSNGHFLEVCAIDTNAFKDGTRLVIYVLKDIDTGNLYDSDIVDEPEDVELARSIRACGDAAHPNGQLPRRYVKFVNGKPMASEEFCYVDE